MSAIQREEPWHDTFAHDFRTLARYDHSVAVPDLGTLFRFEPTTALGRAQRRAAEIYGVPFAYPSTNGTTPLNVLALATLLNPGDKVLIGRDAHVSILAPLVHLGLRPAYITPRYAPDLGLPLQITPAQVRAALDAHPDARALVLTYPNYFGLAGDLPGCAAVARERGVPLIVDGAHGAHLAFHPDLPRPAERCGAAIVTQSQHKTCGALGQASLLLLNDDALIERLYEVVNGLGFVSTSFSSIILASLFESIWRLREEGEAAITARLAMAAWAREAIGQIAGLRTFGPEARREGFVALDPLRLTINVAGSGQTGFAVERALQRRGHFPEFATLDTVLFIVTLGTSWAEIRGLVEALAAIVGGFGTTDGRASAIPTALPPQPPQALPPREVFYSRQRRRVPVREAIGQISAETIATYPPGSALIVAGELLTAEVVAFLRAARAQGATLKGASDPDLATILVVERR
ncbi:MAG TPA: aminotransferase class I/II-fold pyridoxal phosphate-dependent enzyme [Thermomicrobiales bacterium]|jgi:arginine/lysine/ornithine decarboxylase